MDNFILKIAQLSDLHINSYRNLLEPMIPFLNREDIDLVVVTGDTVHETKKELFEIAVKGLDQIRHRVVVLPGDSDGSPLWQDYFGRRYKSLNLNGYWLDFLDTSYLRCRFACGWGSTLQTESPEQYEWLIDALKKEEYHLIFSHHPHHSPLEEGKSEFLKDNVRAVYSGHFHEPIKFYFKYNKPKRSFTDGFGCVPLKFHGNVCYLVILVKDNDEITQIPRIIQARKTAW